MKQVGVTDRRLRESVVVLVAVLGIVGWVTWPLIASYRLHGDDFSLILYSSAPYFDIGDWYTWFTKGYSEYFINYDGWPALGTDFVRPVANFAIYLQGLLAARIGDPAYLLANYAALVGTVLLANVIMRRYTDVGFTARFLSSLALALSPVWYPNLTEASFATNALACFFGVAAIAVLDAPSGPPRGIRLWGCALLQVLAVWSHETAAVIPFVCVALLYAFSSRRPALRESAPFALPVLAFLVARLLVSMEGGIYAFRGGPLTSMAKRVGGYVFGPLVPFDMTRLATALSAPEPGMIVAYGLASLANVALVTAVVLSLPERRPRAQFWALLAAVALSRLPGALVRMEPRFLGVALVLTLVAFFTLTENGRGREWRTAVAVLLVASQAMMFGVEVYGTRDAVVASVGRAGAFFDSARRSIADFSPRVVLLVNDNVGYYSARAMIEMAAWPRTDITPIVVSSYEGKPNSESRTRLTIDADTVVVDASFAEGGSAFFAGALPDFSRPANGMTYTDVDPADATHATRFRATGTIEQGHTLILGVDPTDGSFLEPSVH